ncbi:MAG: hypothetical protein ACYTFU_11080 [Planctomycetota bacterium]|jgi:hypothetical protein
MESQSLDQKFNTILKPKLEESGFTRVNLKGCMCPEYLYNNGRLWFDLSWDWTDRYLEVGLGHLHWFKDVMERVVVVGDYSCYMNQITYDAIDRVGSETKVLEIISSSLEDSISLYEKVYDSIFQDFRASRGKRNEINIDEYIGKEVSRDELQRFED